MLTLAWLVLTGSPLVTVSGTTQRHHTTFPCMGGARVSEEMIEHERAPLPKQPLTFIAGTSVFGKVSARTSSDAKAEFRVSLAPGTYCVLFGEQPPRPEPVDAGTNELVASSPVRQSSGYDEACLRELENPQPKCTAMINVPAGAALSVTLNLSSANQCPQQWAHPCWRGPLPP